MYSMSIRIHNNTKTHGNVIFQPNSRQLGSSFSCLHPTRGMGVCSRLGLLHRSLGLLDGTTGHLRRCPKTHLLLRHRQQVDSHSGRCPITQRSEAFGARGDPSYSDVYRCWTGQHVETAKRFLFLCKRSWRNLPGRVDTRSFQSRRSSQRGPDAHTHLLLQSSQTAL